MLPILASLLTLFPLLALHFTATPEPTRTISNHLEPRATHVPKTYNKQFQIYSGGKWWGMGGLAIILVVLTGLMSGLTLGIMSLDLTYLRVLEQSQDEKQRKRARALLTLRTRPHWLLCSLLLASCLINEALPLLLTSLFGPSFVPYLVSTLAIFLIGDLLPQSFVPRYTVSWARWCVPFVRAIMWLTAIATWPSGWLLGKAGKSLDGQDRNWSKIGRDGLAVLVASCGITNREQDGVIGVLGMEGKTVVDLGKDWANAVVMDLQGTITKEVLRKVRSSSLGGILAIDGPRKGDSVTGVRAKIVGFVPARQLLALNISPPPRVKSLKIQPMMILREDTPLWEALDTFVQKKAGCALVVAKSQATREDTSDQDAEERIRWTTKEVDAVRTGKLVVPSVEATPLRVLTLADIVSVIFSTSGGDDAGVTTGSDAGGSGEEEGEKKAGEAKGE
ncbi:MAG: hypothetical protein M1833_000728 [Piccolia ochrophora]|nr:MAG: hypothetical protein M1833_000728 [Piccolia ochrophora]